MQSTQRVPVPKQPKEPDLSRDERLRIQVLFFDAHLTRSQICLQTGYTYNQICYAISHRLTPQKQRTGRRIKLNTPQRKKLIQWVTASRENRETPWTQIPSLLGFDCGEYAIRSAFKKEGYGRFVERKKPKLSQENADLRLAWAKEYINWTEEQWDSILWSDETWAQPGRHTRTWATRKIGPEEVYHKDCVATRIQRKIGWMFWSSISGRYGRHRGLFWEKDWETINEGSYAGIVIPVVDEILQQYPDLCFQQDNAKGHSSAFVKSVFEAAGILYIDWPPASPGLSPIETVWDDLKDYIQQYYPQVHSSYKRLREVIQEAWESITYERIREIIHNPESGMKARCQAVIDARGWHTKF